MAAGAPLAAFDRLPLRLNVPRQFPRWPPVHQESMTLLVLPNGSGGPRAHDAVNRSGTVAEHAESGLDVGDDKRVKGCRGVRLTWREAGM